MPGMLISNRHAHRPVVFREVWSPGEWRIKVYEISARHPRPPTDLVRVGKELALRELPRPAVTAHRYGVGLLVLHEAEDGNYVFIDWWLRESKLKNQVFGAPPNRTQPEDFRQVTPTGLCGSVWDLHVLGFESAAWMTSVLYREGGPDLNEYLLQRFTGTV